jgi:hypothetical protein
MAAFGGVLVKFGRWLSECVATRSLNPDDSGQKEFLAEYDGRLQWELELKAKLAAHAYVLEKGSLPKSWGDLVPAYLKSLPNVPFGPGDTNRLSFKSHYAPPLQPNPRSLTGEPFIE